MMIMALDVDVVKQRADNLTRLSKLKALSSFILEFITKALFYC